LIETTASTTPLITQGNPLIGPNNIPNNAIDVNTVSTLILPLVHTTNTLNVAVLNNTAVLAQKKTHNASKYFFTARPFSSCFLYILSLDAK
jgi:hypothetical protein